MSAEVPMQPKALPHRDFTVVDRRQMVLPALPTVVLCAAVRAMRVRVNESETLI